MNSEFFTNIAIHVVECTKIMLYAGRCIIGYARIKQSIKAWADVGEKEEGHILFNDAINTFYLRLYGVRHMVYDHSDSERGNPLPPHGLVFSINSKGSFICTTPQTG